MTDAQARLRALAPGAHRPRGAAHSVVLEWVEARLRDGFRARGWTFLVESPSNQQFPILPDALIERLKPEFSCSHTQSFPNGMSAVRFCTSWATTDADIDALLDAVPINA